jgi:hypothetical protein
VKRYIVIVPSIVGNLENWETIYYWDSLVYKTQQAAVRGGWKIYDHDDWLIGVIRDDLLVSVSWMDDPPRDAEELASVAAGIGLQVAP